jgi:hypothetical protein
MPPYNRLDRIITIAAIADSEYNIIGWINRKIAQMATLFCYL